jgi:hypothetical protein
MMPDLPTRGSHWVRFILFGLAFLALIVAGLSFYLALQANGHSAQMASDEAKAAAVQAGQAHRAADMAAAKAEEAARQATAAAQIAAGARLDLCIFLDEFRRVPHDVDGETALANRLYDRYQCAIVLRKDP